MFEWLRNVGLPVFTISTPFPVVISGGIVLTGGTSLLRNLDRLITQEIGISCYVANNPLECVAMAPASPSTTSS